MAKAAFLYLEGEDQESQLAAVLQSSWPCLAAEAGESGAEGEAGREVRAILESPEAVDFRWLENSEEVKEWPIGRAFGASGQLTWRREDDLTHVILITEREELPPPFMADSASTEGEGNSLDLSSITDESLLAEARLWGERQKDGTWREARIPGPLVYPVQEEADRRVKLEVRRYVVADQPDSGLADFVRYVSLVS